MLGSLITMLGFAACKTTKKTQPEAERPLLYGPPPGVVDKKRPIDEMMLLYGVPPVKVEKKEEPRVEPESTK